MSPTRQLFKLVTPYRRLVTVAIGLMIIVAGATTAIAWLIKPLLDDIFVAASSRPDHARRMILILPAAFFTVQLIKGVAAYGQEVLMNLVGQRVTAELRERLYAHLQRLDLAFFDRRSTGGVVSRVINDTNLIQEAVSSAVIGAIRDVFTAIGLLGVVLYRDWRLAAMTLVILPLAVAPLARFGRWVRHYSAQGQEETAAISDLIQESVTGAKVVRAFGGEEYEIKKFTAANRRLLGLIMKEIRVRAVSSPAMEVMGGVAAALILAYGGHKVVAGQLTTGDFFSFLTALVMLYDPIKKLARTWTVIQRGVTGAERVFEVLNREPEVIDPPQAIDLPPITREVAFENVSFSYGRRPVLSDINLTIPVGRVVALVGSSGAGKSTLVNLVPRFYDVASGRITIDGLDIRQVGLASLRSRIGLVTQQTDLFNDTFRANIAYGRPEADQAEIEAAAKAAYIHDFIVAQDQGYDTVIGEQGTLVSGGQRQRLAIARALIKDPPLLILDEATSALDTESEHFVQKAIDNLMRGRTTLVIAHRLSTVHHADRIVVLEEGRIVETGDHDRLMAEGGIYARLYNLQFTDDRPSGMDR